MLVFPLLKTERLLLRQLRVDDFPSLVRHANNRSITDRIVNMQFPYREPQAAFRLACVNKGFKQQSHFCFAIIHREREECTGEISLHLNADKTAAELGYWLGEMYWNQGLITEAIAAVVTFGRERLELQRIQATCDLDNLGSKRVLEKNGFALLVVRGKTEVWHFTSKL
ncbi:MAG: GNAT family N-acetyltransferase [Bacteroidota bacterium]